MAKYYRLKDLTIIRVNEAHAHNFDRKPNTYESLGIEGAVKWVMQYLKQGLNIKWDQFPEIHPRILKEAKELIERDRETTIDLSTEIPVVPVEKVKRKGRPKKQTTPI